VKSNSIVRSIIIFVSLAGIVHRCLNKICINAYSARENVN
jgi:hypothetical protein